MARNKLVSKAEDVVSFRPKPTLRIDSKDCAEVKSMKVGETRTFTVTAKVKSVSAGDEYGDYDDRDDKTTRATLRITKITENN